MKRRDILQLLRSLGVKEKDIRADEHSPEVAVRCLLAQWEHGSGKDSTPSMSIKANDAGPSKWNCFACGSGATGLLHLVEHIQMHDHTRDLTQLMVWVLEADDIDLGRALDELPEFGDPPKSEAPPPKSFPDSHLDPFARVLHKTLADRGVTVEAAKRWGLRLDRERGRALFPLWDYLGGLQGVTGRALAEGQLPKYLHYTWCRFGDAWTLRSGVPRDGQLQPDQIARYPRASRLYGEHMVRPGQKVVLVEGPMDVVMLDTLLVDHGVDGYAPCAIEGAKLTHPQVELVLALCDEVILFGDPDTAGDRGSMAALRLLSERTRTRRVTVPPELLALYPGKKPDPAVLAHEHPAETLQLLATAPFYSLPDR